MPSLKVGQVGMGQLNDLCTVGMGLSEQVELVADRKHLNWHATTRPLAADNYLERSATTNVSG